MELFHHWVLCNEHNEVQLNSMQTSNLLMIHETIQRKKKNIFYLTQWRPKDKVSKEEFLLSENSSQGIQCFKPNKIYSDSEEI
jgi:hypothetical protein